MTFRFLRPLLALVISLAAGTALAQTYRWQNVVMGGGGFVSAFIPSRTQQNLFYVRTDVGGAYRWDKASTRWVPLTDWLSEGDVGLMGTESLALDPKDSAIVYLLAGTSYFSNGKTVVMRSNDYGATFSQITDVSNQLRAHGNGMGRQNGERLQVDPGSSNVLFLGSRNNGLFKSTNSGASFSRVSALNVTTTLNGAGISFVWLDPSSVSGGVAQRIVVGVSRPTSEGDNLYLSTNAGASFSAISPGAPASHMPQRAAYASNGNLYITYANGAGPHGQEFKDSNGNVFRTDGMNAGQIWRYTVATGAWTNVTPSGYTSAFSGISVDPANASRLVAATINTYMAQGSAWGDQFFVSTNGGASWTNVVQRGYALDSGGVTWAEKTSIHWAGTIEFDPFNTAAVWVTSGNGVFRAANIDATPTTWTFTVKGLEETVPLNLASVPGGPLLSAIGDYDGFRHTDLTAYAPIHTPTTGTTPGLAMAAGNPQLLVRVGNSMYYTTNAGSSWSQVNNIRGTHGQVALSANGSVLLHTVTVWNNGNATTTTYRSTDFTSGNPTWTTVSGLSNNSTRPFADPVNSNKFYAYDNTTGTLLASSNSGLTFTNAGSLAAWGAAIGRAAPGREGDLWVALNGGGLARSTNSGGSFSTFPNVSQASAVGFGKTATGASYPTVFIWGSANGGPRGVYRSTDAGASWVRVNDATHQYGGPGNGQFVVGDMNTEGVVYMSTVGRGLVYGASTTKRLQARHSGKCMDVPGYSTTPGTGLVQWACGDGANQQWAADDLGNGYLRLKVGHSGMCVDLASQSTSNGVAIVQAPCGAGTSQQWLKKKTDNGYFRLKSRYSGRCIEAKGANTDDGAKLVQYACDADTNQQWRYR
ncbi:MAG TPA: RICIN domain-containing protein [Ideonella sp.]|uniref:RICIN domain-containing protein n=1 Tax=Ideonella sp. TaxID=1929293 RepID=UPI002E32F9CD|nr:RICIN domain-containing protein [Ideonella sp.]HEX5684250.1 RICIN domain-containing protein [Ideonella sp.]